MAVQVESLYCSRCKAYKKFTKRACPNLVHAIVTFVLLWLLVIPGLIWIVIWAYHGSKIKAEPWRCDSCGSLPGDPNDQVTADFSANVNSGANGLRVLTESEIERIAGR